MTSSTKIDTSKLDQVSYSILVLWLNGAFSTSEIAMAVEVTEAKVRGVYRSREKGGKMPKSREEMSRDERQELLAELKDNRLDRGILKPWCFVAADLHASASSRQGRRELHKQRQDAERLKDSVRERQAAREAGGNRRRGVESSPLEWLYKARHLSDPEETVKTSLDKSSSEMRRYEAGCRFRKMMEDAQIGGIKEVSLEVSAGGTGIAIQERFIMAQSALRAIQEIVPAQDYVQLEAVVFHDEFIWDDSDAGKIARDVLYEEIRRGLDAIALYLGMMPEEAFRIRWGYMPVIVRGKSREEAREAVREANELIRTGTRQS